MTSSASLIRLYRTDIRPVSFATGYDNIILITCLVISFLLVHLVALMYLIVISRTSLIFDYFAKDQLLIGFLLDMWVIGFNSISHAIWWQFEQREPSIPDDYEMLILTGEDGNGELERMNEEDNEYEREDGRVKGMKRENNKNREMINVVILPSREEYNLAISDTSIIPMSTTITNAINNDTDEGKRK